MTLPKYVKMIKKGDTFSFYCCLKLQDDKKGYWRDSGDWGVGFKIIKGKLISVDVTKRHPQLGGNELVKCSELEWQNDNNG